jgi:DNA polymerase V
MDIVAKKMPLDKNGVRIAELDEMSYRRQLWSHTPLTDFWRVGKGIAKKLESRYVYTMGDIARLSVENDEVLYQMFGVNAELLIDHAWGYEPCTIQQIKSYKPEGHSISQGQVLSCPYTAEKGRLIVQEMADLLSLELVRKAVVCDPDCIDSRLR